MRKKVMKKIFCIFSLITMLLSTLLPNFSQVFAANVGDVVEIVNLGESEKHVMRRKHVTQQCVNKTV